MSKYTKVFVILISTTIINYPNDCSFPLIKTKTFSSFNRYRIIALVSVVEKHQQTIQYRMKFSLDPAKDNYVKYRFENAFIYIIVTVLLVYKD